MDLPLSSFVSHFFFLTVQDVSLHQCDAWLPYVCRWESSIFSMVTGLIVEALLIALYIRLKKVKLGKQGRSSTLADILVNVHYYVYLQV